MSILCGRNTTNTRTHSANTRTQCTVYYAGDKDKDKDKDKVHTVNSAGEYDISALHLASLHGHTDTVERWVMMLHNYETNLAQKLKNDSKILGALSVKHI